MLYQEWYLKEKWFSDSSPKNPKKATAILTFTDAVVVGETVTIGNEIYEFVADEENVTEGNIPVVVGSTLTADNAVEKLTDTINANSAIVTATFDKTKDTCTIYYKKIGTEGNVIEIAANCTNANFGAGVTKLSGGQFGTPCPEVNTLIKDSDCYYLCTKEGNKSNVEWKRFTLASF